MTSNAENVATWWRHHGLGTRMISRTMIGWRHAHWPWRPEQIDHKQLQWWHNERDGVSNHRRLDYLLNSLFMRRSKKILRHCVTGHCEGNQPVTGGFPSQGPENISIWWHHQAAFWTNFREQWNITAGRFLWSSPEYVSITTCNGSRQNRRNVNSWTNDEQDFISDGTWQHQVTKS